MVTSMTLLSPKPDSWSITNTIPPALQPTGTQSEYKARRDASELPRLTRMSTALGSRFGLRGCVLHLGGHCSLSQLFPGADDTDLVPLCVLLLALRI